MNTLISDSSTNSEVKVFHEISAYLHEAIGSDILLPASRHRVTMNQQQGGPFPDLMSGCSASVRPCRSSFSANYPEKYHCFQCGAL